MKKDDVTFALIEGLAFFGATESNGGDPDIKYSKERMSTQQAMKASRMGKNFTKVLYLFNLYALGNVPPVGINSDQFPYGNGQRIRASPPSPDKVKEIIGKSEHAGTTPHS